LCRTVDTGYGLDVDRLLAEVPTALFEEWRALYDAEPWDAERSDMAAGGVICATLAARGAKPKSPNKYMPFLKQAKPKPQSQADMKAVLEAAFRDAERMTR
jgi:hypothetical protein